MKLSLLAILLGLGMSVPQIIGLARPAQFVAAVRKFPRNLPIGVALMWLGTAWFVWNVYVEPIADFTAFKPYMMAGFAAVGVLCCFFVQDFLAVRGLAVLMLLLAKLMVDTGRPHLGETPWVLVIQVWAYVLVIAGVWFTIKRAEVFGRGGISNAFAWVPRHSRIDPHDRRSDQDQSA